jgi:hypothetical protein
MKHFLAFCAILFTLATQALQAESAATQIDVDDMTIENPDQYAFVGVQAAFLDLAQKPESESVYLVEDDSKAVGGLRIGLQTSVWRTMFTYESNFDSYQAFLIEADRTIIAGLMEGKGRVYVGVSGGWVEFYGERTTIYEDVLIDFEDYGYAYGGNLGFMYYLSDQVDMSIDYRYLFTSSSCTLDDIQGVGLSLHYFF